jgi:LysR family nitrogen assimilation transcriptional regulator
MRLDFKRLTYFKAIVEAGSISGAARKLSLPQPALSYHLKELEADFGAPLMLRSRGGVTLTEGGQLLLDHATIIIAQVGRASTEMRRLRQRGPSSPDVIRIVAIPSLATPLVPLLLQRASADVPLSGLYVIEAMTREAREMLRNGEADFAVIIADDQTPVDGRLIFEHLLFVMASSHSDHETRPITLTEALAEPLLLPAKGKPVRELVESLAQKVGAPVRIMHEIDGPHPRKNAVMLGLARTFLPWIAIRDEVAKGQVRCREVINPTVGRYIAVEQREGVDPIIAAAVLRMLREILRPMLDKFSGEPEDHRPAA